MPRKKPKPNRRLVVVFSQMVEYRFTIDTEKTESEVRTLLEEEPFDPEDYQLVARYPETGTFDVGRAVGDMDQDPDFIVGDRGLMQSGAGAYTCSVCKALVDGPDLRDHMVQHQPNARGIPFYVLLRMYEEKD